MLINIAILLSAIGLLSLAFAFQVKKHAEKLAAVAAVFFVASLGVCVCEIFGLVKPHLAEVKPEDAP